MDALKGFTHYDALGIPSTANSVEIRKAYRQKALKHHPDKDATENATAYFQRILQAYEVLSSARCRFLYDRGLHTEGHPNHTRGSAAQQRAAEDRDLRHKMLKQRLLQACETGATSEAMKILRGGIPPDDLNAVDEMGRTCLMYAAERCHPHIVSLLMIYKAEVDIANVEGWTPLMCAVNSVGGPLENEARDAASSLLALLRAGANPNAATHGGDTALMTACASGSVPMVQYLLDYAAHVDVADTGGMTPLILAADGGHAELVTLLLNAAASVDVPDSVGKTALMSACALSHKHAVAVLLEANADPLARTWDGCSALLFAIEYLVASDIANSTKLSNEASADGLVTMLLAAQASPTAAADDGRTPLQLAEAAGNRSLVAALLGNGMDCMHYEPNYFWGAASGWY